MKAAVYTSPTTSGRFAAAWVTTKPPYEWPTRIFSPGIRSRAVRTVATSPAAFNRLSRGATTVKPSVVRPAATASQPSGPAKPPWTRTIVRSVDDSGDRASAGSAASADEAMVNATRVAPTTMSRHPRRFDVVDGPRRVATARCDAYMVQNSLDPEWEGARRREALPASPASG